MTRRHALPAVASTLAIAVVCAIAALLVLAHAHTGQPQRAASSLTPTGATPAAPTQQPSTNNDEQLLAAVRKFATAYGVYLDGGPAAALTGNGSVTAVSQATQGPQIPAAFRDGRVRIAQLDSLQTTCCSASVTVVLANREERYPFAEQLLLEQHGWLVDQITQPDLSMDQNLRPTPHVAIPASGIAAAKRFAVAYVNYRSGRSHKRPSMTTPAAHQIPAGTDSLAGQELPKAAAQLNSIQFGPPSGNEFATTATVRAGSARLTFSFLMVKTHAGWECAQYL